MKKTTCTITMVLCMACAFSQSAKEQLAIANSVTLKSKDFYQEIKYQNKSGYFIIPVTIGGVIYGCIFTLVLCSCRY